MIRPGPGRASAGEDTGTSARRAAVVTPGTLSMRASTRLRCSNPVVSTVSRRGAVP